MTTFKNILWAIFLLISVVIVFPILVMTLSMTFAIIWSFFANPPEFFVSIAQAAFDYSFLNWAF